jgi:hypothetical protein
MTSGWANEILTETIDAKGGFNILRDWYNRAVRDDPEGDKQARAPRVGDRSALSGSLCRGVNCFNTGKSTGGSAEYTVLIAG